MSLIYNIIMSRKKGLQLANYFIHNSPMAQHRQFMMLIAPEQKQLFANIKVPTDEEYMRMFFRKLQVVHVNTSKATSNQINQGQLQFRKIFPNAMPVMKKPKSFLSEESEQLAEAIKVVSNSSNASLISYQQLEQYLTIASATTINELKTRLVYLFKLMLNRRDKLDPNGLQLDANLQVSQSILAAFSRAQELEQQKSDWKKLQAMQRLLRAKQYHKKGMKKIATDNFQSIFRNSSASARTRLQALQVICIDSEQNGDVTLLESLMKDMETSGQKNYEDYLKETIARIKLGYIKQPQSE